MKHVCSGIKHKHKGALRQTRHPYYIYENWCETCHYAYQKKFRVCPCCKRLLRTKSRDKPKAHTPALSF
ncbi:hypothetical protein Ngar_c03510 [Candidatus Nitrososphaera gargensis Ga9.2]|uniref:Uncharacterized protein n=1 Tax=Nitrososphaera gargensis (strain Ga9.2) TaxID=1237085 RepID=K0ILS7_NITGG|nr:hypothetical protein Ngar_c03510 [Candidatus Nitrososphaera gargensis Ga9.2]